MITTLDTVSWAKELTTGNAEFVETPNLELFIVSNVVERGGFGSGFGYFYSDQQQFVVLQSDPVPPSPGPGATFGGVPPTSVPVATYTFPQPNLSFDPAIAFDSNSGLLHILGTRNTPTSATTSSPQLSDLIKFTYDTVGHTLSGPFVIAASVGSRIRSAYDTCVLPTGNTLVAMSITDPDPTFPIPEFVTVSSVSVNNGQVMVTVSPQLFVPGQWVLMDNLTNATFLNGQLLQIVEVTATYFLAYLNVGNYPPTSEPLTSPAPSATAVGSSLFVVELDMSTNLPVPGTAIIIDSSPSRSGNTFDGVSLLANGPSIELYYQSHPKVFNFTDQVFTINLVGRDFPPGGFGYNFGGNFGNQNPGFGADYGFDFGLSATEWSSITPLTSFTARYSDNRLTVLSDFQGNRYLSLTYWSQLNHPEGIVGSVLVGTDQGSGWFFHPTLGTTMGGSLIQSVLSVDQLGAVNLAYLLQPFIPVANPPLPSAAAWPLQVASVNPTTLGLTNVAGFYNTANFTFMRGTKSLLDPQSLWAVVGEREVTETASAELHTVPALSIPPRPFTVQVNNFGAYFENVSVAYYPSLIPLEQVDTNPQQGQYTVDTTTGVYTFNEADAGLQIAISYEYISAILPVYASLYNVPPIAHVTPLEPLPPATITVWRGGTFYATDVATITNFSITSNVITVTAMNNFTAGQQIAIYGFARPENQFLDGNTLVVGTASATQFTAAFTHANTTMTTPDSGSAAVLISGTLVLSAASSTDADNDAIQYVWTENDPDLTNVTLTVNGALAAVHVADAIGGAEEQFDVGVATIDLFPDLVTQRHPALVVTDIQVMSGGVLLITFTTPTGAIVPITGENIMLYNIVLGAPPMPTVSVTPSGSLPVQQAGGPNGYGSNFGNNFGNPFSVIVTYVNGVGQTVGSVPNLSIGTIPANNVLVVSSPPLAGDAEFYNVYVGYVGGEILQASYPAETFVPQLLGTNWQESSIGFQSIDTPPPATSNAYEEFLNDQVFTLQFGTDSVTLVAHVPFGYGYDFGFDFGSSSFPLTAVTGSAISQFQFAQIPIIVPENVPPIATFPSPQWNAGNILATTLARNTSITITPGVITHPLVEFPVVYTGLTDPDDVPTYQWTQISGTTVVLPKGSTSSSLIIDTAGVNMNGESLVFSLTLSDGVNPPFVTEFTIAVAAYAFNASNQDFLQLSRSVFAASAPVTEVLVFEGVGTITANNNFSAGQTVFFENMTAAFLEGASFTVLNTGFGSSYSVGFGGPSLSSTSFQIVNSSLPNYGPIADAGTAYSAQPISQRNTAQTWSPLDISIIFTNLRSVKRTSVLDGSDRYIVISRYSVLVYGVFPNENPEAVLMRKLFLPNGAQILDAVHTEQDYTLVLDTEGNIWQYTEAPFINTDNPNNLLIIADFTSLSFADTDLANDVGIFTTVSFSGQRVVVLSGEQGAVLLQMNTNTLAVTGVFTLDVASNFVYGANKVQFVRWVNMDNLKSGDILLGTILNQSASVTNVAISTGTYNSLPVTTANTLVITGANTFSPGDVIVFSGMTNAAFLNGATVTVLAATLTQFTASYEIPAPTWSANTTYVKGQVVGSGNPVTASYIALANASPNLNQNPLTSPTFWALYVGVYGPMSETLVGNAQPLAQSQNSGTTYETLIDLAASQIVGTFDKSKLKNQFVQTGEILFDPDSTYAGGPTPPVLLPPTTVVFGGLTQINLQWQQNRPDLINSYLVQFAVENPYATLIPSAPYVVVVPAAQQFTGDEGVFDTTLNAFLHRTGQTSPLTGQYYVNESTGTYTFNQAQAGDSIIITIRQVFQNLQIVNSGNVESIYFPLPLGRTYFFQVQATGLDGTSGFSNIVSITI